MAKKNSKNDALEALDFIIDVLKEHEKDLDRLIHQLGIIAESLGEAGEITGRIDKIEERLSTVHNEITNLIKFVSSPGEMSPPSQGYSLTVRCNQWQDFKGLAGNAETVTYILKETEKSFQTDAMKEGKIAQGGLLHSQAYFSLAITGIAGPGGSTPDKPVGLVWFAWAVMQETGEPNVWSTHHVFAGDREAVRRQAVATALKGMLDGIGKA